MKTFKQNNKKIRTDGGQAMLISVVLFLVISLTVVIGFAGPITKEFRVSGDIFNSKQTYFLAESGVEDAYYRIKNNKTIGSNETLTLGTGTATTAITTVGTTQQTIDSLGDVQGGQRKVTLSLKTGEGAAFHYGTQGGQGGFYLKNNAHIDGNIYSNGNVIGENGSYVTGTVFAANSPALAADQANSTPDPISSCTSSTCITFGNANSSTQDFAQSFVLSTDGQANKVSLYIKKLNNNSNSIATTTVKVVNDVNGSPGTTVLASQTFSATSVTTSFAWLDVTFSSNPFLTGGTTYWLVLDGATNATNNYILGANSSYASGQGKMYNTSTWGATSPSGLDGYFKFYLGGFTSKIDNVGVGANGIGDAHAHTVTNSTIAGHLYCQVPVPPATSGNNKVCETTQTDPTPLDLPISDGEVAQWKADTNGNIYTGDVTVSGTQTLGPEKIIGNLTITGTLTVADTIYVTGDVTISGKVKLDPVYGTASGIIIADGNILVNNGVIFCDSGTTGCPNTNPNYISNGSYILLLSTSICDSYLNNCLGVDAITVKNNSDISIANASKGSVFFWNNSKAKEAVANRVILNNNAGISYGTGVINVGFQSGPGGGWSVGSWQETQ